MNYIFLAFLGLLLVIFQTTLSNLLFSGEMVLEMSLIVVIHAGFRHDLLKGCLISFIIGVFLDCFMGSVSGLFALFYIVTFFMTKYFSRNIYAERAAFLMVYISFCVLLAGVTVTAFYKFAYDVDKFHHLWDVFFPQTVLLALLGPLLLKLLCKIEVMPNGGNTRSVQRSAIG